MPKAGAEVAAGAPNPPKAGAAAVEAAGAPNPPKAGAGVDAAGAPKPPNPPVEAAGWVVPKLNAMIWPDLKVENGSRFIWITSGNACNGDAAR